MPFHSALPRVPLAFDELSRIIPWLSVPQRKTLLTLCRTQSPPSFRTRTWKRLRRDLNSTVHTKEESFPLYALASNMEYLRDPFFSGYVSMLLRSSPFEDYSSVLEALSTGIKKEMQAAMDSRKPVTFDWNPVASDDGRNRSLPIAPGYPRAPDVYGTVHASLHHARRIISDTLFYPRYSTKTIGLTGSNQFRAMCSHMNRYELLPAGTLASTLDLERLYHIEGARVSGETEVRWSWRLNDLKPRIYYAQGPDQYYDSRYIQAFFNILIDSLPVTHRIYRFHTSSIFMNRFQTAFIYDYASFTSLLNAIRDFIRSLAEQLFKETEICVVDTHHGLIHISAYDMLMDFLDACNTFPSFDVTRIDDLSRDDPRSFHTCGMLGVPGNISSCTLLHGIHLAAVLGTLNCRVVGDDAFGILEMMDKLELLDMLSNIGDVSIEKMEFWEEVVDEDEEDSSGWHYLKRPFDRYLNKMHLGTLYNFPPMALFRREVLPYRTLNYTDSDYVHLRKCANMLISFVRDFYSIPYDEERTTFMNQVLRRYLLESKLMVREDSLFKASKLAEHMVFPRFVSSAGFVEDLVETHWNFIANVPDIETQVLPVDQFGRFELFVGTGSKAKKLARDLGYLEMTPRFRRILVRDNVEAFSRMLMKDGSMRYDCLLSASCPTWLADLVFKDQDIPEEDEDLYPDFWNIE